MFKKSSAALVGVLMLGNALLPLAASAQTMTNQATMPVLYNASGQQVNGGTGPLAAGYYYLGTGQTQQVYYYGNGVYYNAATGEYGGSAVSNPNGTAGAGLGYVPSGTVVTTPGVPNTGAGGEAMATWITLILAALVVAGGVAYLVTTRPQRA